MENTMILAVLSFSINHLNRSSRKAGGETGIQNLRKAAFQNSYVYTNNDPF